MKDIQITSTLTVYENLEELSEDMQQLMKRAFDVRDKAYAPYSKFKVGAAILLENGEVVTGSNQENAAYPSGLCAERTAIFYAGSQFPDVKIKAITITASSTEHQLLTPTPPCGSCRQAIFEYESKQEQPIEIYFMGATGKVVKAHSLGDLLPLAFDKSFL